MTAHQLPAVGRGVVVPLSAVLDVIRDHTPDKHESTLAAHVIGKNIESAVSEIAPAQPPAALGDRITFSPSGDHGCAVISPDEPDDGVYWTLIGSGPDADQNAIAAQIVARLNAPAALDEAVGLLRETVDALGQATGLLRACEDDIDIDVVLAVRDAQGNVVRTLAELHSPTIIAKGSEQLTKARAFLANLEGGK